MGCRGSCHHDRVPDADSSWVEPLADLGPFFAVRSDPDQGDGWRPLRDLLDGPALPERVDHTRRVLSDLSATEVESRVAASTLSLGIFARLLSPVLGAAVLGSGLPSPDFDSVLWRKVDGGPWPLALTGVPAPADPGAAVTELALPLARVLSDRHSLSMQVLRGNVASALFGAVGMVGRARPELGEVAWALARRLLAGPLAGTGRITHGFVRSSCCLYYRVPGGGYCGDCVLATG